MTAICIKTDYITLGQFLKLADIIQNGGAAKYFISDNKILVEGIPESRRGRKLYPGMVVDVLNKKFLVSKSNEDK